MPKSWRDTLFVWSGQLEELKTENGRRYVEWKGTWVGVADCPDARAAPTPNEKAFDKSNMSFSVKGWLERSDDSTALWKAELTNGDGWDLDNGDGIAKYTDKSHTLLMSKCPLDVTNSRVLVVANGDNDFAPFLSAGYCRGNQLTLARRYLEHGDKRIQWKIEDLFQKIQDVDDGLNTSITDLFWKRAPWRAIHLHASEGRFKKESSRKGGKRKRSGEEIVIPLKIPTQSFKPHFTFEKDARGRTKLISIVEWQEQCSGCGKEINAETTSPLAASVQEQTPETVTDCIGKLYFCGTACAKENGSAAWSNLGETWKREGKQEGRRLVALQDGSEFWTLLWENEKARKMMEQAGWQTDEQGNMWV